MQIEVEKLEEAGYNSALIGLSLNKNQPLENMGAVAKKLCNKIGGHNKFLEHIYIWLEVKAPRYWWIEADTYRISSKQSQSTVHTILKRNLIVSDFEDSDISNDYLDELNVLIFNRNFLDLKKKLPEGFLQTREWCMSYKTLLNIIQQRQNHRLLHWRVFIDSVLLQIDNSELVDWALKKEVK